MPLPYTKASRGSSTALLMSRPGASRSSQPDEASASPRSALVERVSSELVSTGSGKVASPRRLACDANDTSASETQAAFTLINGILGGGILGYPFAFRQCGLALTSLLLLLCFAACQLSMQLLLAASQLAGRRSLEDLASHCFGRVGRKAVQTCVFCLNMGALIAYVNILADVLSSVAGTIVPPGAEPSRNVMMAGITFMGALPIALLVRSPAVLAVVSQISVWFVIIFAAVIAMISLSPIHNSGPVILWKPEGILIAFPLLAYGFTSQQFLFSVYSTLRAPSVQRMTSVVKQALSACAVLYVIVGVCGYLAFRERTAGDVLRNFGGRDVSGLRGVYERLLKLGYGFSIMASVPLIMENFQAALLPAVALAFPVDPAAKKGTTIQEQAITTAVLGAALAAAVLVPNVEFIFGLTGSTASVVIAYLLPAALFLSLSGRPALLTQLNPDDVTTGPFPGVQWAPTRRKAYALMGFGLLVGVLCTRATLQAVHTEGQVVSLAKELVQHEQQVLQAVSNEAKAVQVAATFQTIEEAAEKLDGAREEAAATMDAVAQAAAAFTGLVNATAGGNGTLEEEGAAAAAEGGDDSGRSASDQAASTNALALGAVNVNLQNLRTRVDKALTDMRLICANLDTAQQRVRRHQLDLRSFAAAMQSGKDAPGWSFFRHNLTEERVEDLPPGKGAAAAMMLTANASRAANATWAQRRDSSVGGAEAEEAQQLADLRAVARQAEATLAALQSTADALDEVEEAAAAVERAKGHEDDQEKLEAAQAMQRAIVVANNSTAGIADVAANFETLQVTMTKELKQLVATLSREANDAATEALVVAGSNALRGTGMLSRLDGGDTEALLPNISTGANLTDAALAVVDLATRSVDAALRNADSLTAKANVSQEVALQAEAIVKELTQREDPKALNHSIAVNVHALL